MSHPRIAYVTAGGAGMFCGSCMRDNTLARELLALGCDVTLLPTFTPIRTDEEDVSLDRVFLGGINLYLEDRWPWFRRLPGALVRWLERPGILRLASRLSLQREAAADGRLALALLQGHDGPHRREIDELVDFLADELKPDLVCLTNLLIAGFVPDFKTRSDVPVLVTLQGDDIFLDTLLPRDREQVIREMSRLTDRIDGFIVFSEFYRDEMSRMFDIDPARFHLAPMGLAEAGELAAVQPSADRPLTIGYLARICPEKGFDLLVDAFLELRRRPGTEGIRLAVAGWLNASDRGFYDEQVGRIAAAGLAADFVRHEVPDRAAKAGFLADLDVFSVPTRYHEPKGIYVLEALAAGVPVVQPGHGAFPELLEATQGGRLVAPDDPGGLADALQSLLADADERRRLGERGRQAVQRRFTARAMAERTLEIGRSVLDASSAG